MVNTWKKAHVFSPDSLAEGGVQDGRDGSRHVTRDGQITRERRLHFRRLEEPIRRRVGLKLENVIDFETEKKHVIEF